MPSFDSKYTRIPIRAVFEGTRSDLTLGGTVINFKEVHEFYEFRVNRTSHKYFQVSFYY